MNKIIRLFFLVLGFGAAFGFYYFMKMDNGDVASLFVLLVPLMIFLSLGFRDQRSRAELNLLLEQSYKNPQYNGLSDEQRKFIFGWSWRAFTLTKFRFRFSPLLLEVPEEIKSKHGGVAVGAAKWTRQLVWEKTDHETFEEYLSQLRSHENGINNSFTEFHKKMNNVIVIGMIIAVGLLFLLKTILPIVVSQEAGRNFLHRFTQQQTPLN